MAPARSAVDRYGVPRVQPFAPSMATQIGPPLGGGGVAAPQPIAAGQIIARVGSERILAGDVLPQVNRILEDNQDQIPPQQVEEARRYLIQQHLKPMIQQKLVYAEAKRSIPAESFANVEKRLVEQFEKNTLAELYEKTETSDPLALDAKLQEMGASLIQLRRNYMEQALASHWISGQIDNDREITRDEMLDYYQQHAEDFRFDSKARWEELMVRPELFPSKAAAYAALAEMGNQVLRGVPLADIARQASQGVTAGEGGQYDWTHQGSLVSSETDVALFSLPVGQMSQIFEDQFGFHIIRVIERQLSGQVPFEEAQASIREEIRSVRRDEQVEQYLAKLSETVRVWTIFDDEPETQIGAADGPEFR
jgi:parvulin-like peptidyl-prolyl isomerase